MKRGKGSFSEKGEFDANFARLHNLKKSPAGACTNTGASPILPQPNVSDKALYRIVICLCAEPSQTSDTRRRILPTNLKTAKGN